MADHTCISLEQRVHCRSGRAATGQYNVEDFAVECEAFIDSVVGPAVAVGWSQGGAAALATASRRPDLLKGVYLEDIVPEIGKAGRGTSPISAWFGSLAEVAEATNLGHRSVAEHAFHVGQSQIAGQKPIDLWPPESLAFFARFSIGTDPQYYRCLGDGRYASWSDEDCAAILANVKCPVHLAHGNPAMGGVVTTEHIEAVRAAGVNLTSTHFPGASHSLSRGFPREFINDLKAFLARLPA
jgi:pimeloyl-ACP methyl ester carboxylesterase